MPKSKVIIWSFHIKVFLERILSINWMWSGSLDIWQVCVKGLDAYQVSSSACVWVHA